MIKIASVFSGIGGFEKGFQQADPTIEIVFSSELDKYARQIYTKNFGVEPHGDITQITATDIPDHDILCGGFPCQAFSIAGKRRGFEDTRGTLFFEIIRIAKSKRPKLLFLENVQGLLSSKTFITFEDILPLLHKEILGGTRWELKYTPMNNWNIFIENIRTYIATKLLHISDSPKAESDIYLTPYLESSCENLENCLSRGAMMRLKFLSTQLLQIMKKSSCCQKEPMHLSEYNAEDAISSLKKLCLIDNSRVLDMSLLEKIMDMCGDAGMLQRQCSVDRLKQARLFTTSTETNLTTYPPICGYAQEISILCFILIQWNLSTPLWKKVLLNLIKAKENMFYVGTFNIILQTLHDIGYDAEWQVFNSKNHGVPQNRERVFLIGHLRGSSTRQIFPITKIKEAIPETWDGKGICAGTLSTRNQSGQAQWDGSTTLICDSGEGRTDQLRHDVIPPLRANTGAGSNNLVVGCLSGGGHSGGNHSDMTVLNTMNGVRRLTPIECERLQGFLDGWTAEGIDDAGAVVTISDTQRYKSLGNAVTVNVVEFIARHIIEMLHRTTDQQSRIAASDIGKIEETAAL